MPLLTIAEIARQLGIPESTARYYRDMFPEFVPTVGSGRQKRYAPEAVEVIRTIAEQVQAGVPREDIREVLSACFPVTVPQQQGATTQQETAAALQAVIREAVRDVVREELERANKVDRTVQLINEMRAQFEELKQQIQGLSEALEQEKQEKQEKREPWWHRWLRKY